MGVPLTCVVGFVAGLALAAARNGLSVKNLNRGRPAHLPEPCQPTSAAKPPSGPGWIYEIKYDGYRMMAARADGRTRLITRNGHDWAARYPLIVAAVDALWARSISPYEPFCWRGSGRSRNRAIAICDAFWWSERAHHEGDGGAERRAVVLGAADGQHEDRLLPTVIRPSQQSKAKRALQEIRMAETKNDALAAFDAFVETWAIKYDKAVECLTKDRDALLAFYDFPAEHWSICARPTSSKAPSRQSAIARCVRCPTLRRVLDGRAASVPPTACGILRKDCRSANRYGTDRPTNSGESRRCSRSNRRKTAHDDSLSDRHVLDSPHGIFSEATPRPLVHASRCFPRSDLLVASCSEGTSRALRSHAKHSR